jgi:pimeloyl-ACP methyl ester carboxylesterase
MKRAGLVCAAALVSALAAGCSAKAYVAEGRSDRGLVVVLPGIEGPSGYNASIAKGLEEGGVPYAIEVYDWHPHEAGVKYLLNEPGAREKAREVAAFVEAYRERHPGRPVFIVGHSAGAGIAVFATELMPQDNPIDGVVVLGSSLSPTYDLTKALERSKYHLVACSGATDLFIWWMSVAAKNIDGTKGRAAGQEGFKLPDDASDERREAFEHVVQIRWKPSMMVHGNLGGHGGFTNAGWVSDNLAPYIVEWGSAAGAAGEKNVKGEKGAKGETENDAAQGASLGRQTMSRLHTACGGGLFSRAAETGLHADSA